MKILLLNPPTSDNKAFIREGRCNQEQGVWATLWPPITLATSGAILEKKSHDVEILDCAAMGISRQDLLNRICEDDYEFIVWSTATPSIGSDLALANEIKRINRGIKTAVFGTHVTALAEECLRETEGLDFIVRNEPEESLSALAEVLEKGENNSCIGSIEGISYKNGDGKVLHNSSRPFIHELDNLPFPAWHLLALEKYRLPLIGKNFLILSPVRGCPYSCTFCTAQTYYGKRLRRRSVPSMMDEIKHAMVRFNINQFFIWADTFTADRDYVSRFCQAIQQKGLKIGWTCNSRVDTVDQPLLEAMASAGCWMISYGIESGNQAVLDQAKKKTTIDQSRNAVKMAKQAEIKVAAHFVLGLPGESEKTLKETIDFALSLDVELAQFYCATPFPGSSLYELARSQGWIEDRNFEEFRQDNAVMNMPGLTPAMVNHYRKKAFRRFYLRPNRLFQMLKLMRASGITESIKGGLRFMRWAGS